MKKRKKTEKLGKNILIGLVVLILVVGYAKASTQQSTMVFDHPGEAKMFNENILGDDDEGDSEKVEEKNELKQEEQKKEEEKAREEAKKDLEKSKETEIETQDGLKIKTKVEDNGVTKVEIEKDKIKINYEVKAGEVNVVEDEKKSNNKSEVEIEDEDTPSEDELEISTEDERHTVRLNGVAARTNFPLSIDIATNELIVATNDGPKVVTILPDKAVANLLGTGIVDRVDNESDLELQVMEGEPVYQIVGSKRYRFLAIIPIIQPVTTVISAETGEVLVTQQSVWGNIVDFLSP